MLASYSINVRKRLTDRGRVRPPYMVRIGIAMLQGARHEHCEAIQNAGMEMNVEIEVVELRKQSQVDSLESPLHYAADFLEKVKN